MQRYWAFVAALGIGQVVTWAILYYAFSAFVLPMQQALGWSTSVLTAGYSIGLALWALGSYGAGALIDRGRGRVVMTGGTALGGAGVLLWSMASHPSVYLAAWVLIGLAMAATLYEPAFTILTRRYPDRYRHGITALTLIGGFASTLAFPVAAWLLSLTDWRSALAILALVLILGMAPLHWLTLRDADGLVPSAATQQPLRDLSLPEAARTGAYWLLTAAFALHLFISGAVWAHIVPVLDGKGIEGGAALSVLVVIGPAQVLGRLVYMIFGTATPPQRVGIGVLLGIGVALGLLALAAEPWQALVFGALFGACNGLMSVLRGSLLPGLFGRASLGRIAGSINATAMIGRSIGPFAIAALVGLAGGYARPLWLLALLAALAAVCIACIRPPHRH